MNKENKSLVKTTKQTKSSTNSEKVEEKVPEKVKTVELSNEAQTEVTNYINSLSKHETQTLEIAKSHLGSSFSIRKSIGFLEWKSKQKQ